MRERAVLVVRVVQAVRSGAVRAGPVGREAGARRAGPARRRRRPGQLAGAAGLAPELTPGHDGRIVADIVAEWSRRHGQPYTLTLQGPAGGDFTAGDGDGDAQAVDAVEFVRILSGRAEGTGLRHKLPL